LPLKKAGTLVPLFAAWLKLVFEAESDNC